MPRRRSNLSLITRRALKARRNRQAESSEQRQIRLERVREHNRIVRFRQKAVLMFQEGQANEKSKRLEAFLYRYNNVLSDNQGENESSDNQQSGVSTSTDSPLLIKSEPLESLFEEEETSIIGCSDIPIKEETI